MKILITGGSGFLGINLIRFLLKKNYQIISLDLVEFSYPEIDRIDTIIGDIRNRQTVRKAIFGCEMVIHCAMALPLSDEEEILTTGINGTKILFEESEKANIKRFVHISSTAVYGIPNHHPIFEDDTLNGVGPYGIAKVEAEKIAESFRTKICVPILRPKSFIGPERLGIFALLYDWAQSGKNFPIIGKGDNKYQLLDVEDLCQAIFQTLTLNENIVNDVFNIGAKNFTTIKEDYQSVLDIAGYGKKVISLPEKFSIFSLKILEALRLSPIYKWVYETASKDSFVSIEKAELKINYRPKYSNKEALKRNYTWYLENLDSISSKTGTSHRVRWKQGILNVVKYFF